MQFPDMCKEQAGCSEGCDHGVCQNEVGHLAYRIHNIHDHIIAMRLWELNNEVNTDGVLTELQNGERS